MTGRNFFLPENVKIAKSMRDDKEMVNNVVQTFVLIDSNFSQMEPVRYAQITTSSLKIRKIVNLKFVQAKEILSLSWVHVKLVLIISILMMQSVHVNLMFALTDKSSLLLESVRIVQITIEDKEEMVS
jgi:hypothetical protein